jgi:hypothetical protein
MHEAKLSETQVSTSPRPVKSQKTWVFHREYVIVYFFLIMRHNFVQLSERKEITADLVENLKDIYKRTSCLLHFVLQCPE